MFVRRIAIYRTRVSFARLISALDSAAAAAAVEAAQVPDHG